MRKLFLLISLLFTVYYGSSLWNFADAESYTVITNYIPLALLIIMFIIGLLNIKIAISLGAVLVMLLGNPALLDTLFSKVFENFNYFEKLTNPIESIILGTFAAWILLRFFGNPNLDYEVNRAKSVRSLHFPIFVLAFTAVVSAILAIVASNNFFAGATQDLATKITCSFPFAFFAKANMLAPIRSAIYLLEGIAVYIMVVNEFHSARQIRSLLGTLLVGGLLVFVLGCLQRYFNVNYFDRLASYNNEIQSTLSDPNTLGIFFLVMLPAAIALLFRSIPYKIVGGLLALAFLTGIIMTATKSAILLAALFLGILLVVMIIKSIKNRHYVQTGIIALIFILPLIGYLVCIPLKSDQNKNSLPNRYVQKIDDTCNAAFKGDWDIKALNKRSNYKIGDWMTACSMVRPDNKEGLENLMVGVGQDNFDNKYNQYFPRKSLNPKRGRLGASNMFLFNLAENGLASMLALLIIVFCAIYYTFRSASSLDRPVVIRFLGVSMLLLVLACMAENSFVRPQIQFLFWTLTGLCIVSSSLADRAPCRCTSWISFILLIGAIGASAYVYYPHITEQKAMVEKIHSISEEYAEKLNLDPDELNKALEKHAGFGFNYTGSGRWSEKESFVLSKVTDKIISFRMLCATPDCTTNNPVRVSISIDGTTLDNIRFTDFGKAKLCEVDLTTFDKLKALVENNDFAMVQISSDRTWVPAKFYPKFTNDTFQVGVKVEPITYRSEFSPKPKPRVKQAVAPKQIEVSNTTSNTTQKIEDAVTTAAKAVKEITTEVVNKVDGEPKAKLEAAVSNAVESATKAE